MKVLHLLSSNKFSGAENVACKIINSFKKNDQIEMVYSSPQGPIKETLSAKNIIFYEMKNTSLSEVNKVIKYYQPDIVHAHDLKMSVISAFLKKISNNKFSLISHLHNNHPRMKKINLYTLIYLFSLEQIDKVIVVSKIICDEFIFNNKMTAKTIILPNVINHNEILEKANKVKYQEKNLIFVGRMSIEKQPLQFIEIIESLKKHIPNITSYMIGSGPIENDVKDIIQEKRLAQNIEYHSFSANPYAYMNVSQIVVVPSIYEGFGLVGLEGMSLKKPVIANQVGGLSSYIDNDCGALCNNKEQFVEKIYELLKNDNMYLKKSIAAYQKFEKLNNETLYTEKLSEVYNELF